MFDQRAYNHNDQLAKETVSGWLTRRGSTVLESGRYDVDLSVTTPAGQSLAFECERRHLPAWGSGCPFPYPTITVPARKKKFALPGTYFATVNAGGTSLVVITAEAVTGSPLVTQFTRTRGPEQFYAVPTGSAWHFPLP